MKIIYPPDYFNLKEVDEMFKKEADAFRKAGFDVQTFNYKSIPEGEYIYRGWMLTDKEYLEMEKFLTANNSRLITSFEQYQNAHYMNNWYESLSSLTPKSIITSVEDLNINLMKSKWNKFFVKDFVKSLTTSRGSIANSKEEVQEIIKELNAKKGITGGIVLREVHDFVEDSEIRYFCLNGKVMSPAGEVPLIASVVASIVKLPFFSIDIIQDTNGKEWVVEIGDGQVSDLKIPWKPDTFVSEIKKVIG